MTGNHNYNERGPRPGHQPELSLPVSEFPGFDHLSANFTYTPNQFFDVCLPHSSRGVVRLVAYMIRQTLGYCDPGGTPQRSQIQVSWSDIEREAGLSRRAIPEALEEAIEGNFLICMSPGVRDQRGIRAQSASYALRWDSRPEYIKDPKQFKGFYEGEGNRTDIPNQFFDHVVPTETLVVVKLIGTVLRYSVGFSSPRGGRRTEASLSYQFIQDYAEIGGRRHVAQALDRALEAGYLIRTKKGFFDRQLSKNSYSASYAVRWSNTKVFDGTGAKREPSEIGSNQGKKGTETGAKREPSTQGKRGTSTNKTLNKNLKQQQRPPAVAAEDLESFKALKEVGFDDRAAELLAPHRLQVIQRQIEWLPRRGATVNQLGMLRLAITEDWPEPTGKVQTSEQSDSPTALFVKYAYAVIGGNNGEPMVEPSKADLTAAEPYVARLLAAWPHRDLAPIWGQSFGKLCRSWFETRGRPTIISLAALIRSYGDEYASRHAQARREKVLARTHALRAAREEEMKPQWMNYLAACEAEIRSTRSAEYALFVKQREEHWKSTFDRVPEGIRKALLQDFQSDRARLEDFRDKFRNEVLSFEEWDRQTNGALVV